MKYKFKKADIEKCVSEYKKEKRSFEKLIFEPPESPQRETEEFLGCVIGTKAEFEDIKLFWIKAFEQILEKAYILEEWEEWGEEDNSIFVMDAQLMLKDDFRKKILELSPYHPKNFPVFKEDFLAYQLKDDWNERIFLLENEEKFQLIYWETTS